MKTTEEMPQTRFTWSQPVNSFVGRNRKPDEPEGLPLPPALSTAKPAISSKVAISLAGPQEVHHPGCEPDQQHAEAWRSHPEDAHDPSEDAYSAQPENIIHYACAMRLR